MASLGSYFLREREGKRERKRNKPGSVHERRANNNNTPESRRGVDLKF
jgi:hypothetical protein